MTDDDGWGPIPTASETAALEIANIRLRERQLREEIAYSLTAEQAAEILGLPVEAVTSVERLMVRFDDGDGRSWFPAWQISLYDDEDGPQIQFDWNQRLVRAFSGNVVALSRWMRKPNANFGGRIPATELLRDPERVVAIAETLVVW